MTDIPQEFDDVHLPAYAPKMTIISPLANEIHDINEPINVKVAYQTHFPLKSIDFFLGDVYIGSTDRPPFEFSFTPAKILPEGKLQENLRLVAYDEALNKGEANFFLYFRPEN